MTNAIERLYPSFDDFKHETYLISQNLDGMKLATLRKAIAQEFGLPSTQAVELHYQNLDWAQRIKTADDQVFVKKTRTLGFEDSALLFQAPVLGELKSNKDIEDHLLGKLSGDSQDMVRKYLTEHEVLFRNGKRYAAAQLSLGRALRNSDQRTEVLSTAKAVVQAFQEEWLFESKGLMLLQWVAERAVQDMADKKALHGLFKDFVKNIRSNVYAGMDSTDVELSLLDEINSLDIPWVQEASTLGFSQCVLDWGVRSERKEEIFEYHEEEDDLAVLTVGDINLKITRMEISEILLDFILDTLEYTRIKANALEVSPEKVDEMMGTKPEQLAAEGLIKNFILTRSA